MGEDPNRRYEGDGKSGYVILGLCNKQCKYKHGQSVGEDPNRRYEGDGKSG